LRDVLPDDVAFDRAFGRFEVLQSLWAADIEKCTIMGSFMCTSRGTDEGPALSEIVNEQKALGADWRLFKAAFFGGKPERLESALKVVREMVKQVRWM
jgi:hypothetical protein